MPWSWRYCGSQNQPPVHFPVTRNFVEGEKLPIRKDVSQYYANVLRSGSELVQGGANDLSLLWRHGPSRLRCLYKSRESTCSENTIPALSVCWANVSDVGPTHSQSWAIIYRWPSSKSANITPKSLTVGEGRKCADVRTPALHKCC